MTDQLTPADIAAIEARVTAATPGPWTIKPFNSLDKEIVILEPAVKVDNDDVDPDEAAANAALIANAPTDLARLLADRRELVAEVERLKDQVYAPGEWRCAKCSLRLTAKVIASSGLGMDEKPQQCPNDCGPMWRVTEREYADQVGRAAEQLLERATAAEAALAAEDWRPIAEAPRDGTTILACGPDMDCVLVAWKRQASTRGVVSWVEAGGDEYHVYSPTHWRPLPAPPAREG